MGSRKLRISCVLKLDHCTATHTTFVSRHPHINTADFNMQRPAKRLKISAEAASTTATDSEQNSSRFGTPQLEKKDGNTLKSLRRSVTPPPRSRPRLSFLHQAKRDSPLTSDGANHQGNLQFGTPKLISSPIKLTNIRDLPSSSGNNVDTIKLRDILGDPMIRECWQFNYLFEIDFLMNQFDDDVRSLVKVKVVHGSWKKDAPNRIRIEVSDGWRSNLSVST
jgi:tyrosyl-DNA phosphodiesterase 1